MTKLLIVDDNEQDIYMLQVLLKGYGYKVVTAVNGAEALEAARHDPPDMIITDILMPVMDGFTLCREWKKDEMLKAIPFVFYTATYTEPKDEKLALSLGAERFIVKPAEPDVFVGMLQEVIREAEAGRLVVLPGAPVAEEPTVFREYSERLVRKLEKKVLALQREITERKRAEEALRESEEKRRTLSDSLLDLVFEVDSEGNVIYANKAVLDTLGYSMDEFLSGGIRTKDVVVESVVTDESFGKGFKGNSYIGERTLVRKDGSRFIGEVHSSPIYKGEKIVGARGIIRDITERKRAEEALQESEERYRSFVQNFQGIAYRGEMNFVPLFFHGAVEEITGYTEDEFVAGRPRWDQIIHPDDLPRIYESGEKIRSIPNYSCERDYRIIRKDRQIRWIHELIQNICDDDGEPILVQGALYDITERKRAEEERQRLLVIEHEQRLLAETLAEVTLALTSQISHSAVLDEILRQAQRIVPYNTANIMLLEGDTLRIARWQGYETFGAEGLISNLVQPLADFLVDAEAVYSRKPVVISDTRQDSRWVVFDETAWIRSNLVVPICLHDRVLGVLRLDGEAPGEFSAEDAERLQPLANAAAIALENARLYQAAQQELAERKQAEEALQESEERYRSLFERVPVGLYRTTPDGQILDANLSMAEMLGYPNREALCAVNASENYVDPEDREHWKAMIERDGIMRDFEVQARRRDGTIIWVHESARAVRDAHDRMLYYEGSLEDITERKRVEEMKDNLIRDVSHELKTPLAKMQMGVDLLMEMVGTPSLDRQGVARASEIVAGNVQRLQHTVNSILDLSSLESGRTPYQKTKVQPEKLIGQVILDMRPLVEAKGLELVAELPEGLPQIEGDREGLLRVLTNLIDNAVKFTDQGKIVVSAEEKAQEVEIAVSDSGYGILRENLERVFERFQQESPTIPGAGVGLAICKAIVEAHGGMIWAESAGRDQGTTVRFTLPM